jgi:hypothetical protein
LGLAVGCLVVFGDTLECATGVFFFAMDAAAAFAIFFGVSTRVVMSEGVVIKDVSIVDGIVDD